MRTERELLLLITKRFQEEFNNVEWYSNFDKELIDEIEKVLAQPEFKYSPTKACPNKIDGSCPLHNLQCNYPECEK
jgi:hypothetical protein